MILLNAATTIVAKDFGPLYKYMHIMEICKYYTYQAVQQKEYKMIHSAHHQWHWKFLDKDPVNIKAFMYV